MMSSRSEGYGEEELLRGAGLRVTAARIWVLNVMRDLDHPLVEEVERAVRERLGVISTQGVYDVLRVLEGAGLVRRLEPAGSAVRYERRVGDNHHHLVCRVCGEITDADCSIGKAPCLHPSDGAGYLIDEADIIYWGICPDCQRAEGIVVESKEGKG